MAWPEIAIKKWHLQIFSLKQCGENKSYTRQAYLNFRAKFQADLFAHNYYSILYLSGVKYRYTIAGPCNSRLCANLCSGTCEHEYDAVFLDTLSQKWYQCVWYEETIKYVSFQFVGQKTPPFHVISCLYWNWFHVPKSHTSLKLPDQNNASCPSFKPHNIGKYDEIQHFF